MANTYMDRAWCSDLSTYRLIRILFPFRHHSHYEPTALYHFRYRFYHASVKQKFIHFGVSLSFYLNPVEALEEHFRPNIQDLYNVASFKETP